DLALCGDGARHIQRRDQAQFGDRHTGRRHDHLAIAGAVLPADAQRIDAHQIGCGAGLFSRHGQYTPSMTASPSNVVTGRTALTESLICGAGPGIRIATSRSRLLGMNIPLLMWFITTWPSCPYGTCSPVSGSTTQNTT